MIDPLSDKKQQTFYIREHDHPLESYKIQPICQMQQGNIACQNFVQANQKKSRRWPPDLTSSSLPSKLVLVLVGLPARGKSYISKKLKRYLNWNGLTCRVFNAGDYRRKHIGSSQEADYFKPDNEYGRNQRAEFAQMALNDLLQWLQEDTNYVGIFDATNTTKSRRSIILERCRQENAKVLFLECICTDSNILEENYRLKLDNEDYRQMDKEKALNDFRARVAEYEKVYEPIDESDSELSYIKVINVGEQIVANHCGGQILSQIATYLPNLHIHPRTIYLCRHGQSLDNIIGRLGGNASLSETGKRFSEALRDFVASQNHDNLVVWTSTLARSVETIEPLENLQGVECYQTPLLNEINAGICEGLTYDEIKKKYPSAYLERCQDKLNFRYQHGGESYIDVRERLRPLIVDLERKKSSVLVICHQAVTRIILGYFLEKTGIEMVNLDVPLHKIYKLQITPFGCNTEVIDLGIPPDDFRALY